VPCTSPSVDEDNEDENKEDDDDADEKDDDTPPEQLQQRPRKKSKLARSGNGSISTAVMKIFLKSQDSVDLEKPTKAKSWVPSTNKHVVKTAEEMQTDYPVRWDKTFRHGYIP